MEKKLIEGIDYETNITLAEKLNISRQAISHRIQRLEQSGVEIMQTWKNGKIRFTREDADKIINFISFEMTKIKQDNVACRKKNGNNPLSEAV